MDIVLIVVGVVASVVGLAFAYGWQTTVAICLGAFAVVLLVTNLQELSRN